MSLENIQLLDNEPFDESIVRSDHLKKYHQQGAKSNDPDQNVELIFEENNNYHQTGNAYLEVDITVRDTADAFTNASNIRLINNALAYCFKEARLATMGRSDLEHNKYVGKVSTIMCLLTSKDSDLSSFFDKSGEGALNDDCLLKRILINSHIGANKGKYKGKLELKLFFRLCKTCKKITKNVGFHQTFKTVNLQDKMFTTIATDINVTISNLLLYVPTILPNTETQYMFN